jgi:hypothetical protein
VPTSVSFHPRHVSANSGAVTASYTHATLSKSAGCASRCASQATAGPLHCIGRRAVPSSTTLTARTRGSQSCVRSVWGCNVCSLWGNAPRVVGGGRSEELQNKPTALRTGALYSRGACVAHERHGMLSRLGTHAGHARVAWSARDLTEG